MMLRRCSRSPPSLRSSDKWRLPHVPRRHPLHVPISETTRLHAQVSIKRVPQVRRRSPPLAHAILASCDASEHMYCNLWAHNGDISDPGVTTERGMVRGRHRVLSRPGTGSSSQCKKSRAEASASETQSSTRPLPSLHPAMPPRICAASFGPGTVTHVFKPRCASGVTLVCNFLEPNAHPFHTMTPTASQGDRLSLSLFFFLSLSLS